MKALMLVTMLLMVGSSKPLLAEPFVIEIQQNTVCEKDVLDNIVRASETDVHKAYVMTQMALQLGTCSRLGAMVSMSATVVSKMLHDADGYEMYIVRVEEPIPGYTLAWPHLNIR